MNNIYFDGVGFDLDGTLLDTFRDLGAAVNYALEIAGLKPVAVESSKDLIGGGAKIMLAKAVEAQVSMPPDDFRALYKTMLKFYSENYAVYTRPYPFATAALEQLGLSHYFTTIIGGNSMGKDTDGKYIAKPSPIPILMAKKQCKSKRFIFVGDSTYDVKAAKGAGLPVIAAAYGYCDREPAELGADAVIDSLNRKKIL
jgi:phosphoglycolate phosphatase